MDHIVQETESQGIRATFRDSVGELFLQLSYRLVHLSLGKVALHHLVNEVLESGTFDNLKWVYYVSS